MSTVTASLAETNELMTEFINFLARHEEYLTPSFIQDINDHSLP